MRKFISYWIVWICLYVSSGFAQTTLTLEETLRIALENNYAIQLAKVDAGIASNNNRPGAAGMMPVVTGTAGIDNQVINTEQKFLNGTENNREGALSNQMNAGIELGWTIFDGFKMFAAKNRLEELQKQGELRMRAQIEQVFVKVIRAYYEVQLAQTQLKTAEEAVAVSNKRLDFINDRYKAGKSAKTEMLKAQVDLNADKAVLMRLQVQFENLKANLNLALARDSRTAFEISDTLFVENTLKLDEWMQQAQASNTNIQMAKGNRTISLMSLREIRAERMPTVQLKSGYNFSRQESQAGFLQSAQNIGFHYGAGLSLNLFNGWEVKRKLTNAELGMRYSDLVYRDSLARLKYAVEQAYANYQLSLNLLSFERENLAVARENFDIASEQYRVGVITGIELRDAQQNYMNNELRLLQALFEARMHETELKRLSGTLLKL
ncbi:MAG: TolC family protein [Bacteroidia bacterium]